MLTTEKLIREALAEIEDDIQSHLGAISDLEAQAKRYRVALEVAEREARGPTCQCFGAGSPDPCPIHDGVLEDLEDDMPDEVDGAR